MFWTYILHSKKYDKYYIGFTHCIEKRLIAHNHIKNKGYTKKYQPWNLIYSKEFRNKQEAMRFERYLKSLKSKTGIIEFIHRN
jgi:putative endonuclease